MTKQVRVRDITLDDAIRELDAQHVEVLRQSKKSGSLLPPPVVMADGGTYRLIAGNHCFHALTADGEESVTVRLVDRMLEPKEFLLMQTQENEVKKDFTFTERIRVYTGLVDAWGWTQAELAERLGKSESYVSKLFNRAKKTHPDVLALHCSGKLGDRHTDAISKLPLVEQVELAALVVAGEKKAEWVEKEVKRRLKREVKRNRKLRFKANGLDASYSGTMEELLDDLVGTAKAVRKALRLGLGPESLPNLLAG